MNGLSVDPGERLVRTPLICRGFPRRRIRRAHPGFDGHVAVIHQQRGHVADAPFAELIEVALDLFLDQTLQAGVQRGFDGAGEAGVGGGGWRP